MAEFSEKAALQADFDRVLLTDDGSYNLDALETEFFSSQTGIKDEEELKKHISRIRTEAYEVYPYPCIRRFAFTRLKISRLPAYSKLLALGKERKGAIFLDIGCCFGNDARKAIVDGYPAENVIASDLHPEFWQLGLKLFKSTPETFPVPFFPGDAFDSSFIQRVPPFYSSPETPRPDLHSITSLTPLLGHISAIHASSFFHLFNEEQQSQLAHALGGLLSPEPGSMILGAHGGRPVKGLRTERRSSDGRLMFCHSPESWTELWDGEVFKKGTVKVEAVLYPREVPGEGLFYGLIWSVTRL